MKAGYFDSPQSLLSDPKALIGFSNRLATKIKQRPDGLTTDDIAQDAALIVIKRCQEWERGDHSDVSVPFEGWVWTRCLGDLRDRYKTPRLRRDRNAPAIFNYTDCEARIDALDTAHRFEPPVEDEQPTRAVVVRSALELLSDVQRFAVEAIYFEGLTQAQYAERAGISQPAVSLILARALRQLRSLVE